MTFTLNFRLAKAACLWPMIYTCTSVLTIKRKIYSEKNTKMHFYYYPHCNVSSNFKNLSRYSESLFPVLFCTCPSSRLRRIKEKWGLKWSRTIWSLPPNPKPRPCPLPAFCLWKTLKKLNWRREKCGSKG